ncbi:DegT/DnrJ/EryC1/StrS family aminotransferase [uncultured Subdoligranulum sp.]|uniref:DegT/DnrJ/EryC1/StrS family aminotransferase n=1 Tax=uncultured Subdoligranulum sp. TaxID=512298 RepID=UPI0025EB4C50|nr:DegT/DnrJ/EryC1/StrS family aminotransferase [uncultured Subdoligranulum sp.]
MSNFIPLSVPNFGPEEAARADEAIRSGWVSTSGARVGEFEGQLAAYVGMPRAVAANAGSSALHLAALAAGIGPGQEVIVPTLTFIAAVSPLTRYVGAEPVFIGCDDSLCIDPDAVEDFCANRCTLKADGLYNDRTGARVAALEVVHVFGNMADMPRLLDIARRYRLTLIEDATEALGTRYTAGPLAGRYAGTMGDAGCYSFNGNKIITTGAGGMLVSNHPDWAEHAKHLSTQAKADELQFLHDEVGYNYRMTNVQASLGLAQLARLEDFIAIKQARYDQYRRGLDGVRGLRILPFRDEEGTVRSNHWFFSLDLRGAGLDRDRFIAGLQARNIQTRPVWALIHEQADYPKNEAYGLDKALGYRAGIVNLPCSTNLTEADCDRVIEAVLALAAG